MNPEIIQRYVENSLQRLRSINLMIRPHANMPDEMIDKSKEQGDDWIPWKDVPAQISEMDIEDLENKTGFRYPDLYKTFLNYKHFYNLDNVGDITFFKHCIRDWKKELIDRYFKYDEPDELIRKGFIPFADYSDWGIVCFDTNRMNDGDCPIVIFDHETLFDDPVTFDELYKSFGEMMKKLVELQEERKNVSA